VLAGSPGCKPRREGEREKKERKKIVGKKNSNQNSKS
jgi:hypothetical protein